MPKNNLSICFIAGRYCEWKHKSVDKSEESSTFEDYKKTLKLECKDGKPGSFTWMPDEDTPDLVYYQVRYEYNLLIIVI